jgi:hypothetical protein
MQIFCTSGFKDQFEKLISKKQYSSLEYDIVNYFFNKRIDQILSGVNLNNSTDTPYIKKRLKGRGGYRVYFLAMIKNDNVYLIFVHPKTGPYGASNLTDKSKAYLYKNILRDIKNNNLFILKIRGNDNKIIFNRIRVA